MFPDAALVNVERIAWENLPRDPLEAIIGRVPWPVRRADFRDEVGGPAVARRRQQ